MPVGVEAIAKSLPENRIGAAAVDLLERQGRADRRCGHGRRGSRPGESYVYRDGSKLDEVVGQGRRSIQTHDANRAFWSQETRHFLECLR